MELDRFLEGLRDALVDRGIPPEAAAKHAAALGRTFSEDDLAEIGQIRSNREIDEIADSIAAILYKNKNRAAPPPAAPFQEEEGAGTDRQTSAAPRTGENTARPRQAPDRRNPPARENQTEKPADKSTNQSADKSVSKQAEKPAQNSADFFTEAEGEDRTTKGVAIFWTLLIVTLPFTVAILAAVLALFGAVFLGIILAIIGLVIGMIALVAAGSGLALVGVIYGITQLFSFAAAGVYEIGLGIMIIGISLFGGVVLYNLAIRFLPWVMSWLTVFFLFVFGRFRNLFYLARRECYKL